MASKGMCTMRINECESECRRIARILEDLEPDRLRLRAYYMECLRRAQANLRKARAAAA